jgi:D-alanyl-D-alanine dipeptidase
MGACFYFFDELSHVTIKEERIGAEAYRNRIMAMQRHSFVPYEYEFWHFDYHIKETDKPIDIPITEKSEQLWFH